MPTIKDYFDYAQTTIASYATVYAGVPNLSAYMAAGMADQQARAFSDEWSVLKQSPISKSGFSAVLLERGGEKVLAIRGTESSQVGADYVYDLVNIVLAGSVIGLPQYAELESFYSACVAEGKLRASEQVTVTGHSLGGFLAQAFTAVHPAIVTKTYTYNSPGFGGAVVEMLEFFGLT